MSKYTISKASEVSEAIASLYNESLELLSIKKLQNNNRLSHIELHVRAYTAGKLLCKHSFVMMKFKHIDDVFDDELEELVFSSVASENITFDLSLIKVIYNANELG